MGKTVHNDVLDDALDRVATATLLSICTDAGTPANLDNAVASVVMTAGDGNGDYTVGDGDTNGRKIAVAEQADIDIDIDGTALHVVLSLAGTILLTTTCTSQALVSTGTVTVPTFDYELADPT